MDTARDLGAINVARLDAVGDAEGAGEPPGGEASPEAEADSAIDVVIVHLSNSSVEPLLERLEDLPGLHVSFFPQGVLALKPPPEQAPEQVKDVEERSPVEVLLAGVQSVGGWMGLFGYAVAAGVVVWVGLLTNTVYLLTAAMLIAPFAGPAMNAALATASGDTRLLGQSLARYGASLGTSVLAAAGLSLLLGPETATAQMIAGSTVSEVALVLPLVAGAAGALSLMQSDGDNLVSGAAVGILVAASLAPPAGVVGMGAAIGRWDLVGSAGFVLALQLAGINFTGALVFRLHGLAGRGARFPARWRGLFPVGLAATGALLAGLLVLQFGGGVHLERSSLSKHAATEVRQSIKHHPAAALVEVNARFPRTGTPQHTLLVEVYVQRRDTRAEAEELHRALVRRIEERLQRRWPDVTPLVSVTVLEPPPSAQP